MQRLRKKISLVVITLLTMLILVGCKDEQGKAFIGHWYQITEKDKPNDVNISYDDGVFHVDDNRFYPVGLAKYKLKKLEAKAISDNVLQGANFSMRLEGDKLYFQNDVYEKK